MNEIIDRPRLGPRRKASYRFVPVIFANGKDDDTPGLVAAFRNREVLYDDKTYQPNEALLISGRKLVLTKCIVIYTTDADEIGIPTTDEARSRIVVVEPDPSRFVAIENCDIDCSRIR